MASRSRDAAEERRRSIFNVRYLRHPDADPSLVPDRGLIERMRDPIAHRGPDGAGLHLGPGVGLGHRRLSIVDVAHGQQPMYSDDRRFVLVYNGEVFNHPALKPELEAAGVRYRTRSDTETVLHLYERLGERAVERMRGMFAFAIWDSVERRLFLARDRYGVKPLYYVHRTDGTLIFGSEIKALLPALGARRAQSRRAAGLPRQSCPLGRGHAVCRDHAPAARPHADLAGRPDPPAPLLGPRRSPIRPRPAARLGRGARARRGIPRALHRGRAPAAHERRAARDVPLGGIDSAAITATMATLVKEPIRTFSVAFAEREANELEFARLVATAYRTEHREIVVTPADVLRGAPAPCVARGRAARAPLQHRALLRFAARGEHVKVVLTGEGSDETLAGYNRYRVTEYNARLGALYRRCVPRFARRGLRRALEGLPATSRLRQIAARTFLMRGADLDELYFDNFAVFARAAQRAAALAAAARGARADRSVRGLPRGARAGARQAAAVAAAVCGREDLPARAADEAGPDEHGGIDREPRAVPRPSAHRVGRRPAADDEAARHDDQVDPARRRCRGGFRPRSSRGARWASPCRWVVAAWALATAARASTSSGHGPRARPLRRAAPWTASSASTSAASITPSASGRC